MNFEQYLLVRIKSTLALYEINSLVLQGKLEAGAEDGSGFAPLQQVDLGAEGQLDVVELADRHVLRNRNRFWRIELTETWATSVMPVKSVLMWKSAPLDRDFLAATAKFEWSEPITQPYLTAKACESPD